MKCQGTSSHKWPRGGGRGDEQGSEKKDFPGAVVWQPLKNFSASPRLGAQSRLHFCFFNKSNVKLVAKTWPLKKKAKKPMTYWDILVILSAWPLWGSLYALTTAASAVPPHSSTWTLRSGKRQIGIMLRRPEKTSQGPHALSALHWYTSATSELLNYCHCYTTGFTWKRVACLQLVPQASQGLSEETRFSVKSWILWKLSQWGLFILHWLGDSRQVT